MSGCVRCAPCLIVLSLCALSRRRRRRRIKSGGAQVIYDAETDFSPQSG